ncbi:MAG: hypothetical protein ACLQUY_18070 [Ktedonobacterales bacterium]
MGDLDWAPHAARLAELFRAGQALEAQRTNPVPAANREKEGKGNP